MSDYSLAILLPAQQELEGTDESLPVNTVDALQSGHFNKLHNKPFK